LFAGVVLLALAVAGPFALIVTAMAAVLLALVACAGLIALSGAILVAPMLLVRRRSARQLGRPGWRAAHPIRRPGW
jgi:hypothetical protein